MEAERDEKVVDSEEERSQAGPEFDPVDGRRLAELLAVAKERGVELKALEEEGGQTLLMVAARQGHLAIVQLLLEQGLNIDAGNEAGKTALHLAVWRGHGDVVSFLLESCADVCVEDHRRRTALLTAAISGDVEMARLLLKHVEDKLKQVDNKGAVLARCDENGRTALWHAVVEGHADMCKLLIQEGEADFRDPELLKLAKSEGHRDCIELIKGYEEATRDMIKAAKDGDAGRLESLLSLHPCGMPKWAFGEAHETLLLTAAGAAHVDVARLLVQRGADIDHLSRQTRKTPLLQAVLSGHAEMVSHLLNEGAGLDCHLDPEGKLRDERRGSTAVVERRLLCHAAEHGHVEVARVLLQEGRQRVDVNAQDDLGHTALWLAAKRNDVAMVKLLLEAGADTTLANKKAIKPLTVTKDRQVTEAIQENERLIRQLWEECAAGHVAKVAGMLASHPELVNGRRGDRRRQTVMMAAAEAGHVEVVRLLVKKGVNAALSDLDGQTALMLAATRGEVEVVKVLLEDASEYNINHEDSAHQTALVRACEKGHMAVATLLIVKDAKLETTQGRYPYYDYSAAAQAKPSSALAAASGGGHLELVELLLEYGGWSECAWASSLVAATKGRYRAIIIRLLAKQPYVDIDGFNVALSEAAAAGDVETVRLLAENVTNDESKRPRCLASGVRSACRMGRVAVLKALLLEMGGHIHRDCFEEARGFPDCLNLLKHVESTQAAFIEAVRHGNIEAMESLLEVYGGRMLINSQINSRWPLQAAVKESTLEVVMWLVKHGAVLHMESPTHRIDDQNAVTDAITRDDMPILHYLLAMRARSGMPASSRGYGYGEMVAACTVGRLEVVEALIEVHEASARTWFESAVSAASGEGHAAVVRRLLQTKGQVNPEFGPTALPSASRKGYREVVMELLVGGADPDVQEGAALNETEDETCAYLLMRASAKREYLLSKASCIHGAATVVPACLAARAAEGLVPLPTVVLAVAAETVETASKRKRSYEDGEEDSPDMEVVCEVARFVVEGLKADLQVELMEMMLPTEEDARRLVQEKLEAWKRARSPSAQYYEDYFMSDDEYADENYEDYADYMPYELMPFA